MVPVSRTKLALSKKRGSVKQYLDGLQQQNSSSISSRTKATGSLATPAFGDTTRFDDGDNELSVEPASSSSPTPSLDATAPSDTGVDISVRTNTKGNDRAFERWLFSDWLQDNRSAPKDDRTNGRRSKEPALPVLKDAKWNSGDNPVVATAALMIVGLILTASVENLH